jgi:hypothetical protein
MRPRKPIVPPARRSLNIPIRRNLAFAMGWAVMALLLVGLLLPGVIVQSSPLAALWSGAGLAVAVAVPCFFIAGELRLLPRSPVELLLHGRGVSVRGRNGAEQVVCERLTRVKVDDARWMTLWKRVEFEGRDRKGTRQGRALYFQDFAPEDRGRLLEALQGYRS